MTKAVRVKKALGADVLALLRKNGWLDTTRNTVRAGEFVEIPVIVSVTEQVIIATLPDEIANALEFTTQSQPALRQHQRSPFKKISDMCEHQLKMPATDLKLLPQKWELIGDVLILRLPPALKKHRRELSELYADVLRAKSVLLRTDKIHGIFREPNLELLSGNDTETLHTENGVKFKLDLMKVMFSSGNIDERMRISTMAKHDETVVDMFAGIGYFSLPLAVHSRPAKILACELNPNAYDYLRQNIELNQVGDIVQPILGDNRKMIPGGIADRILMGYIKSESSHLISGFKILKPTGGIIHYHDVNFNSKVIETTFDKIEQSLKGSEFKERFDVTLSSYYKIKSYGPKLVHVVLDVLFEPK